MYGRISVETFPSSPSADLAVPDQLDVSFSVPFTHRVRFTADVLGAPDDRVLLDVLESAAGSPARVLAVVESADDALAAVGGRLRQWAARHPGEVELIDVLAIDGGERVKNDAGRLLPVLRSILQGNVDRRNYVLAVGGGALLDAVGFAAAIAHRGIRLVRLPTTVMGQADSGVGVKNAINFFGRKNWVGTFAVPWAVVNDATLLATLSDRDWRCGFAEAVKVSLLKDSGFFDQLCGDAGRIGNGDRAAGGRAIRRSAYWHLAHITRGGDPFESREARPLDFGHWSAHRLEAMTGFALRHGEAVAIGLAIDCAYSRMALGFPAERHRQVVRCLTDLQLPLRHPALDDVAGVLAGLEEFRQHLGGRLTVTMLRDVGEPIDVHEVDPVAMRRAIAWVNGGSSPAG
jgi:3-dehydroquinate synthase